MDEKYLELAGDITEHLSADTLADIQRQLQRSGQADCEECGELISPARRQAMPSAIRCIACQQQHDLTRKGFY